MKLYRLFLASITMMVLLSVSCDMIDLNVASIDDLPAYSEECLDLAVNQSDFKYIKMSLLPSMAMSELCYHWYDDEINTKLAARSGGTSAFVEIEIIDEVIETGNGGTITFNQLTFKIKGGVSFDSIGDFSKINVENLNTAVSVELICDIEFDGYEVDADKEVLLLGETGFDILTMNNGFIKGQFSFSIDFREFNFNMEDLAAVLQEKDNGDFGLVNEYGSLLDSSDLTPFIKELVVRSASGKIAAGWKGEFYTGCTMEWESQGKLYGTKMQSSCKLKSWNLPFAIDIFPMIDDAFSDDEIPVYQSKKDTIESIMDNIIGGKLYMNPLGEWFSVDIGFYDRENNPVFQKHYRNSEFIVEMIYPEN